MGLTSVLHILDRQLGKELPHTPSDKEGTVDDILIHIAILLNAGSPSNLAVAVSGSQRSIMDMTLVVVAKGEGPATSSATEAQGACRPIPSYLTHSIYNERLVGEKQPQCTSTLPYPYDDQPEYIFFQHSFRTIAEEDLTYKGSIRHTRSSSQCIEPC